MEYTQLALRKTVNESICIFFYKLFNLIKCLWMFYPTSIYGSLFWQLGLWRYICFFSNWTHKRQLHFIFPNATSMMHSLILSWCELGLYLRQNIYGDVKDSFWGSIDRCTICSVNTIHLFSWTFIVFHHFTMTFRVWPAVLEYVNESKAYRVNTGVYIP